MATIGTGKYGTITGLMTPAGTPTTVGYYVDADNYFTLEDVDSSPDYHTINSQFAGETYSTIDLDSAFPGPAIKIEINRVGQWSEIVVYGGATAETVAKLYTFFIFDLPDSCTWTNIGGSSWTWTAAADPAALTPSPNDAAWYEYQKMPVISGAYRRVSLVDGYGDPTLVFSNGDDADYGLISVETQEYHDPTTTKLQIDSCRFAIHTPFDRSTSQTVINAFMEDFAPKTPFDVEGGWSNITSMGYDTYDVTGMGRFYITEAHLNKQTWVLEVEGEDEFGFFTKRQFSSFTVLALFPRGMATVRALGDGIVLDTWMDHVLNSISLERQTTTALVSDDTLENIVFLAPIHANVTSLESLRQMTNFSGGRWYSKHDNTKALICSPYIADLDYQITPLMMYGLPIAETYEQPNTPNLVAAYKYDRDYNTGTVETLVEVPRLSGLNSDGSAIDLWVPHAGRTSGAVYGVYGGVETQITGISVVTSALYKTYIRSTAWQRSSTTVYDTMVVKGIKMNENETETGDSTGSVLKNPLVTTAQEQNALLSWSFPDYAERAYRFTMRDDPSLKCGNVVQLAVENEYLNVLLVEAKRTFNGAGRAEYLGVYVSDTGDAVYETEVVNATATWLDESSEISGATLAFDNVAGYDDWPNVSIQYLIYEADGTLVATLDYPNNSETVEQTLAPGDTFTVRARIDDHLWPAITATNVLFDNTDHDDRPAGGFWFHAGEGRLY